MTVLATAPHAERSNREPLLKVDDLQTSFVTERGVVRAVDGVSLTLRRGETLGIVGESGSGKSVLSRSIMRLLPTDGVRSAGSVHFAGRDLVGLGRGELQCLWGSEISMVFQDPMTSLNPVVRIGRQVAEALQHHRGIGRAESRRRAVGLLRSVGIAEPERRMRDYPHHLSGGLRQRVTIAMALACGPQLLLADEPTTALDVTIQAQILDLLRTQQREREMAMILVSHDLGVVANRTDTIAVMYGGKIVERAPTVELFARPMMPYTVALLDAIPRLSGTRRAPLRAIPGRPPSLLDPPPGCRFAPRCARVQARCAEQEPPLSPSGHPEHLVACWFPVSAEPVDVGSRNGALAPSPHVVGEP